MKLVKLMGFVFFVFLCTVTTPATADVIVYSEKGHYGFYWHSGNTVRTNYSNGLPGTINAASAGDKVIVVNKVATYWIKSAYGGGRIRITVPLQVMLASWDVKALERELERLGIKVRSKPIAKPVPKPGTVISG